MKRFVVAMSTWLFVISLNAFGGTFNEEWYLMRGAANFKIGNTKAAIEAYEKASEINPDNLTTMRALGLAYANEGLTDKAIRQFDRYLAKKPADPEILFKQADYLSWTRYSYRRDDAASCFTSAA